MNSSSWYTNCCPFVLACSLPESIWSIQYKYPSAAGWSAVISVPSFNAQSLIWLHIIWNSSQLFGTCSIPAAFKISSLYQYPPLNIRTSDTEYNSPFLVFQYSLFTSDMLWEKSLSRSIYGWISNAISFSTKKSYRQFSPTPLKEIISGTLPTITISSTFLIISSLVGIEIICKSISGYSFWNSA